MILQETKATKGGNRYFLTIPKDLVQHEGWKKGTRLLITPGGKGELILKEIQQQN